MLKNEKKHLSNRCSIYSYTLYKDEVSCKEASSTGFFPNALATSLNNPAQCHFGEVRYEASAGSLVRLGKLTDCFLQTAVISRQGAIPGHHSACLLCMAVCSFLRTPNTFFISSKCVIWLPHSAPPQVQFGLENVFSACPYTTDRIAVSF